MKLFPKLFLVFIITYSTVSGEPNIDLLEYSRLGNLDGVKNSLSEKANINYKDSLGTSALMFAANNNHFPVVKYLVDNNADVLAKNTNGWTAAVLAGARGNTLIKEFLEGTEQKFVKSRASGVVLAVIGEAYVENKKLKLGDVVLENQTIFVAKKSQCDLQVKQSLSEFVIRIKENSMLTFKFKEISEENIFSGFLKLGTALFKIENAYKGERIQVVTPTSVASVRGTLFETAVAKDGSTNITVFHGAVKTRVRAPEIEDDEVIENTPEVKKLISNLEHNSQMVTSGHSVEVTPQKQSEILKKADAEGLRKRATREEFSTESIPTISLKCSDKPTRKSIKSADILTKQKESEDLVGIDPGKLKNTSETSEALSLIESRKEEKTIANFQPEVLRLPERILLKNGQIITGSIYQLGQKYIVFSSVGKQVFDESEVERYVNE